MVKKYISIILVLGITIIFFRRVVGTDIGSDTAVTRFNTQQELSDGDRIAGFAALDAGFRIDSLVSTATFDSFFQVSGDVELNFGTLVLNKNLILDNTAFFRSLGNVVGQGHVIDLSSSAPSFPFFNPGFCNASNLADLATEAEDVQTVDWSYDDKYIVIGMGGTPAIPIKIYYFDGETLTQKIADPLDYDVEIFVTRWHPSDYFFALGRLVAPAARQELRIFEYDPVLNTITATSGNNLGKDVYAVAWHPSGDFLAVAVNTNNQELQIFSVDSSGVLSGSALEIIGLTPNRKISQEAMDWNATGEYLIIGTKYDAGNPEVLVYDFDETTTTLTLNASYEFGGTVNAVSFHPTYTGYIAAGHDVGQKRLAILEHDATAGTIDLRLSYGNDSGAAPSAYSTDWGGCGICLAVGWQDSVGQGNIEEFQTFEYDPINVTLTSDTSINLGTDVESVRWSPSDSAIAIGGEANQLRVYFAACGIQIESRCVTFSNLDFYINRDTKLRDCCITFSGDCNLHGRGYGLEFSSTTTLRIAPNSSLGLHDLTMKGVREQRFSCLDNSSTVSLTDMTWVLDDIYSFTVGKFYVVRDWCIAGENQTFVYQSSMASTISEDSSLIMENNTTFSYDPPIASNQLLVLEAATSELRLNGATLHATSTGLRLTKGILSVDRWSTISSEATVEAEGIILGDGVDADNDIDLQGLPAANLDVTQGHFVIDNVGG